MILPAQRIAPQPVVALVLCTIGATLVWQLRHMLSAELRQLDLPTALLALALIVASIIAESVTIQIDYRTKTSFAGSIFYLMAVLLSPGQALLATFVATLISQLIHRRKRRLLWFDIATDVSRFMLIVTVAAVVHAWAAPRLDDLLVLGLPALLILVGDFLSMPLLIAPITGQPPHVVLRTNAASVWLIDGAQYLIAVPVAATAISAPTILPLLLIPLVLVYQVFLRHYHLQDSTRTLLENMADMVDLRDPYTGGHSRRVAETTAAILAHLAIEGVDADLIVMAARVHDIGKVGVPDAILNKPARLTDEERQMMEQHPVLGANLLLRYPDFARGVTIIRHHHERVDGGGYPDGLVGSSIPFGSLVIAVADTWDALTSDRPYRSGMNSEGAARILFEGRGTQWRADLVDALLIALGHEALLAAFVAESREALAVTSGRSTGLA
jgi:HD-GYP domain-containing protein (c-di-GMP phosphodiesterase class II)